MPTRPIDPSVEIDDLQIEIITTPHEQSPWPAADRESTSSAIGALAGAIALIGAVVLIGNGAEADHDGSAGKERAGQTNPVASAPAASSAPMMTVEPVDELSDGQTLTITGTGFRPGTTISLTQCVLGLFEPVSNCYQGRHADLDITDNAGEFTTAISARRYLTTDGGVLDCAALSWGRCALVVTAQQAETSRSSRFAGARQLRFADSLEDRFPVTTTEREATPPRHIPQAPSRRRSSLDVSISRQLGLSDGDSVSLRILDGMPRTQVQVELCDTEAPGDASCPPIAALDLNSYGGGNFDIRVPRLTRSHHDGELVDCAGGCKLRLVAADSATDITVAFDADGDLLDRAALSIEGDILIPDHPVSVTGAGFIPLTSFDTFVCSRPIDRDERFWIDPVNWCGWPADGLWANEPSMTPDGSFRATLIPPTAIDLLSWSGPHNCLMQDCWLVVATGRALGTTPIASARLTYEQLAA